MSYVDKALTCRDCGAPFTFTEGEQEFFAQKGFTNEPTRCPECRSARSERSLGRAWSQGNRGRASIGSAVRKSMVWSFAVQD